ncbi:histidine phosphatase family protein [Kitasatospora purpeofusca]|uniref:histidine phosphatase family protein n=1 Tax=Kitasatospora purpeofusca TaxID=67352 RepID=UPI0036D40126
MSPDPGVRLLVRRHAESLWNAERRIHGRSAGAGLSAAGAAEATAWAAELPSDGVGTIWCSDTERATATAGRAAQRLAAPLLRTPLLAEAGAGCLEGLTHAEAERRSPDHLRTWLARGDLDAIPEAEPGDRLQARALAFLAVAAGPGATSRFGGLQVVVTHAAFLRCLVNTANRRCRTRPVPVAHTDRHLLVDPWRMLAPARVGPSWRPSTHAVDLGEDGPYLVKQVSAGASERELARYLALQRAVAAEIGSPPPLAAGAPSDGPATVVRRFVTGDTVPHRLDVRQEWRLLDFYQCTNRALHRAVGAADRERLPSLDNRVADALRGTETEASAPLRRLAADRRVAALLSDRSTVTDHDLHRDNTLRTPHGLVQIDLEGLSTGPASWADACALTGASALYPGAVQSADGARPHRLLLRGDSQRAAELRVLTTIRLLLGLTFFLTGPRASAGAPARAYAELYRAALAALGPDQALEPAC